MAAIPSTSYSGIDEGVQAIFDLDLDATRKLVQEANGNVEFIVAHVDKAALRAAVALEDETLFERFSKAHPTQLIPVLTQARERVRSVLGDILANTEKRQELDKAIDEAIAEGEFEEYWSNLDILQSIHISSEWAFKDGEVTPRLRVHFTALRERIIFNSALDWDDIIFVAYRLLLSLRDDMENLKLLSEEPRSQINIKSDYGDRLAKRLSNIRSNLDEIRDQLCALGFSKEDFGF